MTVQYTMNTDEDQSLIHILMFVRIMLIHYIKWKYCIQNTLYDMIHMNSNKTESGNARSVRM
jgi:hypothetical protein